MRDIVLACVLVGFFVLMTLFVRACAYLVGSDSPAERDR